MTKAAKHSTYQKCKDSGVEWLDKIPKDWEVKKLKYLSLIDNSGIWGDEEFKSDINSKVATTAHLTSDGNWLLAKMPVRSFSKGDYEYFQTKIGDIIVVKSSGSASSIITGKAGIIDEKSKGIIFSNFLLRIRTKKNMIHPNYLYYFLISHLTRERIERIVSATTYPNLKMYEYCSSEILLPNHSVQIKIVNFLDQKTSKIDQLIQKNKKLVKLLEEKRQAIITQAVTKGLDLNAKMKGSGVKWIGKVPVPWKIRKIRRLSKVRRGASPRPIDDPIYFDDYGEYGWVRISDVTSSERYLLTTTQKLSKLGKSLSVPLEPGNLFLSIAGSVGKPIITKIKCCIHDGFVYFVNLNINEEYLYYIFISGEAYKGLGKLGTQLNLNTNTIGDIFLPIPSKNEQGEIVKFLDKKINRINLLINKIHSQNKKLEEYRQALISNAVTGKIKI